MTRPEWCPQDVWEAAIKCAETVLRNLPDDGDLSMEVGFIARAILAERQRCADKARSGYPDGTEDDYESARVDAADAILKDTP